MKILFVNAKAWTGGQSFVDAVGIDSITGKIIFTGNASQADKKKNDYDEVIPLNGRLVLPGLCDGHCHFIQGSYVNSLLNLRNAKTKNDFIKSIKEYRSSTDGWIQGGFFADSNFIEKIDLSKTFLDDICSDVPVLISRFDAHSAFANTKALDLSGILNRSGDFTEEEIIRNSNGEPTGELKERARNFVLDGIPPASLTERINAALKQMNAFNVSGITSISDITLVEDLEVYKELLMQKKLKLKTDARLPFDEYLNVEKHKADFVEFQQMIQFRSFKAFYDGSLSSKTSYMHENFKNADHNGIRTEYVNDGSFRKAAFEIDGLGYQMSVHAIGDKAVTELLDLNEELISKNGRKDRRFRIEHAQHIRENDFKRFKEMNVIASVQPAHLFSDAKTATEILQDPKLEHNYKKLMDDGAIVCFGTDFPIVSEDPFENIYYAMTRKVEGFENGFVTENSFTVSECLEAYTFNNAYAAFNENTRGRIAEGMDADIVIMENDLLTIPPSEIKEAKVSEVYFNGERIS